MADIILESLAAYGDSFRPEDMRDIVDSALSFLPIRDLAPVIVEALGAYGDEEASIIPDGWRRPEISATFARIAWASILPEVDSTLPLLDGTNPPREAPLEPDTLTVECGRACRCDCGCNDRGVIQ
jgi:hypothetical protein